MQTRKRTIRVSVFPILLLSASCKIPIDDRITVNDDGGVDFTEYAGVRIIGTVSMDGAPADPGPLDLAQLTVALYTKCIDSFIEENEPVLMGYCTSGSGAFNSECCAYFCDSILYNCLANELMTLAESTDVFEFETEIRNYYAEREGEEIVFDIEQGRMENPDTQTRATFLYRIPPLNAKQKTLVYIAARAAAKQGGANGIQIGIRGAEARLKGLIGVPG